jgi:hypothetical protein
LNHSLFIGSFNAEKLWKDLAYASLPSIQDAQSDLIVEAMDEMQFVFCQKETDYLVSQFAMNAIHKNYLYDLGFTFTSNQNNIDTKPEAGVSIFEALTLKKDEKLFSDSDHSTFTISPYSIQEDIYKFCSFYAIKESFPSIDVIKKVNSKIFSSQISSAYAEDYSLVINNTEELELKGGRMLNKAPIIIKDPFGVSGKGNLYVNNVDILRRIVNHLKRQEREGKKIQFVIEYYLQKEIDFSSHFLIHENGSVDVMSIQLLTNKHFSFDRIRSAEPAFVQSLEKQKYFFQVESIAKILFEEGYHGPVCLDSMVLRNGAIIPVIEINARKSMGMINHYIDKFLNKFNVQGNFITLSCIVNKPVSFEILFDELLKQDLLFTSDKPYGIIPISANSFDINAKANHDYPTKGRLYIKLVNGPEDDPIMPSLIKVFMELGVKVLS